MHLQNALIFYIEHKNLENEVKVLIKLINKKRLVQIIAVEEENVNMKNVTLKHISEVIKHRTQPEGENHQGSSSALLRMEEEIT